MTAMLQCGRFQLPLDRPLIMGIVNVTPDSFSDGGQYADPMRAVEHGLRLFDEGADIVDVGGESTRPSSDAVPADVEVARVLPVVEGLLPAGKPVSVDTSKPVVMRRAIEAGADMINDVHAFRMEGAVAAVAPAAVALCVMHMQGDPRTMQADPRYDDVVLEVRDFLAARVRFLRGAGVAANRLVVDPGFGFGKNVEHNLALLRNLDELCTVGPPVLAGISRKSMLGRITGRPVGERVFASVAAALLAAMRGARILRVHDVRATVDALAVLRAVQEAAPTGVVAS